VAEAVRTVVKRTIGMKHTTSEGDSIESKRGTCKKMYIFGASEAKPLSSGWCENQTFGCLLGG